MAPGLGDAIWRRLSSRWRRFSWCSAPKLKAPGSPASYWREARGLLSGSEFFLVCDRRPGRPFFGIGFRIHEYGRTGRRLVHGVADAADRETFGWTASFLVAAAFVVTGAVAWLFVDPKRTLEVTHSAADIPMTAHSLDTTVPVSKNH